MDHNSYLLNKDIKICHWNIHGKKSSIIEDKLSDNEFIKQIGDSDIVVLTETHSDEKDLFIPGYKLLKHKIRSKTHKGPKISGGIAAFAKENLETPIDIIPDTGENSIWIKIERKAITDSDLYVGTYYLSPKSGKSSTDLFDLLNEDINRFKGKGEILIQGDFNARVGDENDYIFYDQFLDDLFDSFPINTDKPLASRNSEDNHTNPRGLELLDFCKTNEFLIVNGRKIGDLFGKYTSNQYNGSSTIDLLLTTHTNFEKISYFKVGDYIPWLSDHSPIFSELEFSVNKNTNEPPTELYERDQGYIWDDNCKEQFKALLFNAKEKLDAANISTRSNPDPNHLVDEIKHAILQACKQTNLKKRKTTKSAKKNPWFDKECFELKRNIKNLGKRLQSKQGNKELRDELFRAKTNLKKLVKSKKKIHKKTCLEKMEQCNVTEQKRYWKLVRQLNQNEIKTSQYVSPKNLSLHFKSILNSKRTLKIPQDSTKIGKLDYLFTSEELEKAAKSLKPGKASGIDNLSNEMIAAFFEIYPHIILTLFNNILDSNTTIHDWTKGIITAIHKKGSKSDPENYRGISLLSCLGKFFTSALYNRLLEFSIKNKILSPTQLGFVPGNRTSDAHLIIHNLIHKQCHINNGRLYTCFIDFSKAFDTIPRDTLLNKLLDFGIEGKFFNILKNIYTNDKICIKHGNKITDYFEVNLGVKQGCILSPLLFNIYLADLPKILDNDPQSINKTFPYPSTILWADDIAMFSESEEGLAKMLKTLEKYCDENELTLNTDKTKCMIFNKNGRLLRTPFYYNNVKLENVKKFKYLGFLLTPSGETKSGLKDLKDRALKAFFKLKSALGESFRDHIRITLKLFDSLIKPILMYMSDFWGGLKPPNEKDNPIEKLHIMACKYILGVQKQTTNIGVLLELGRVPMQKFAVKSAIKNWERINQGKISEVLIANNNLAKSEKLPWLTYIETILQTHNMENHLNKQTNTEYPFIHKLIYKKQCDIFHQNAFQTINSPDSKLRTYSLLKTEVGCEEYLHTIRNAALRQTLTKFRLSNHPLNIEKGRHTTPKTPKEIRFCPFCPTKVEDEEHFLMECPTYKHPRNKIRTTGPLNTQNFRQLPKKDQFVKLMTNNNTLIIAKYIHNLMEIRNFLIQNPKRPI